MNGIFSSYSPKWFSKGNFTPEIVTNDPGAIICAQVLLCPGIITIATTANNSWQKNGNVVGGLNWLGTIDNFALPFRVNNLEVARIQTDGSFQIGGATIGGGEKLNVQNSTFATTGQFTNTLAGAGLHYGIYSNVSGAGGTNVAGYFTATGAGLGLNFAAIFAAGNVQINETIVDSAALDSIMPTSRRLMDTTGGISINWELKTLYDAAGAMVLDWENGIFQNGPMQIDLGAGTSINISTDAGGGAEGFLYMDPFTAEFSHYSNTATLNFTCGNISPLQIFLDKTNDTITFTTTAATGSVIFATTHVLMGGLQVGNAGLASGELYVDTAANILANGDLVVGRKA